MDTLGSKDNKVMCVNLREVSQPQQLQLLHMNDQLQLQLQLQLFDNAMADICQVEYIVFLVDILN
jgi:hypothetical protein